MTDPYQVVGQALRDWLEQIDKAILLLKSAGYRVQPKQDYSREGCATGEME
jgi:hypothetical protein